VQVGDLVKFDFEINRHWFFRGRLGIYLGEAFIYRTDGVVVENHKVLIQGDQHLTIIDKGLLQYVKVLNASR